MSALTTLSPEELRVLPGQINDLLFAMLKKHHWNVREVNALGVGPKSHPDDFCTMKQYGIKQVYAVDPAVRAYVQIGARCVRACPDMRSAPKGLPWIASHPGFCIPLESHVRSTGKTPPTWAETIEYLAPPVIVWCSYYAEEAQEDAEFLARWGYVLRATRQPALAQRCEFMGGAWAHTISVSARTSAS